MDIIFYWWVFWFKLDY